MSADFGERSKAVDRPACCKRRQAGPAHGIGDSCKTKSADPTDTHWSGAARAPTVAEAKHDSLNLTREVQWRRRRCAGQPANGDERIHCAQGMLASAGPVRRFLPSSAGSVAVATCGEVTDLPRVFCAGCAFRLTSGTRHPIQCVGERASTLRILHCCCFLCAAAVYGMKNQPEPHPCIPAATSGAAD